MTFQILDDRRECYGIYYNGSFIYDSFPNNLDRTWEWCPHLLGRNINYGSIYGIITTDDMPLIKIIRKGSTDDTVLLRSNNPEYEDYEIPKAKIQALFQFLGKATIKGITN